MEKAVYRILDANFNRAREALRGMEEYCRFVLNNAALSGRVKALRHALCQAAAQLEQGKLLCSRDSQNDVGKALRFDGQMKRLSLEDCFVASAKRITEALRAMAEVGQTISPSLYDAFERLRFDAYTLEKDIYITGFGYLRMKKVRLYVLLTVKTEQDKQKLPELTKACIAGGADCLQLRCKGLPDREILNLSETFTDLCRKGDVLSIINDSPDIAILSGADGVHLGQEDIAVEQVRLLQPRPLIAGVSTHNIEQLGQAITQPCDYVALGPVFATQTKSYEPAAGLGYLNQAMDVLKQCSISHVAIGGITLDNVRQVLEQGIQCVAICSAICSADSPEKACRNFKGVLNSFLAR
ncbi:MAG: thiamine phosphate synthase [Sedimentisphaerales bacterium]|nr:thiamine phosphate synthase [Sedimentisphaerales bacterium]